MTTMSGAAKPAVTFLITALGVGGAETQLARLAIAMAREGRRVRVIALRERPGLAETLRTAGVPVHTLTRSGRRPGAGTWRALLSELRREPDGCIVTFLLQANVLGRLAGARCRLPVVSSIRNTYFGGDGRWGRRVGDLLERLTVPLARAVVINARSTADALVARGIVPATKVRVVGNALPPPPPPLSDAARARERTRLGIADGDFVWMTAGRLQPQKNHAVLLEAFADIHHEAPASVLWVAGEGPLGPSLMQRATSLGMGSAVRFLGLRQDLPLLLPLADAFVLASRWEGLPNVVMEALAAGLPTVSTSVGGVDELIEDDVSGWLAASPEQADLAAAMRRLATADRSHRTSVATTGRVRVLERFGLEAALAGWEAVIAEACAVTEGRG